VARAGEAFRPLGEQTSEAAGRVIVARGFVVAGGSGGDLLARTEACRTEEDDGVFDALAAEAGEGFLVFRNDAEETAIGGVEESVVLVRERSAGEEIRK
jgi:hypothetical protein